MKSYHLLVILCVLLSFGTVLSQDDTCSALVEQTITVVNDVCASIGRNQACYGNIAVNATPREGIQDFVFEQQGDLANIADIETLRLSSLDPVDNQWGVALMKLQANLPDSLPGQNVTLLLFGNVEIQNAVASAPDLRTFEVSANGGINVRSGPSTDNRVIGSLAQGETALANGRNEDASWLRIQLPDSDSLGWVRVDLVTFSDDASELTTVDPGDNEIPFKPMQAFYFKAGVGGVECDEAPGDGILIQTPAGAGTIQLRANDVDIQLGSTAYLQAQPGASMSVSVVEGEAVVSAQGASVTVPAGAKVEIPIDDDLQAAGEPGEPEPYDQTPLETLPITLLPESITIADPISEEDLAQASEPTGGTAGGITDLSNFGALAGMDPAFFCPAIDQALAESGMSRQDYLAMLQSISGSVPPESQGALDQLIQIISQCP